MTPEIKAAIVNGMEKHLKEMWQGAAGKPSFDWQEDFCKRDFKAGAEFGYKLGLLAGKIEALKNKHVTIEWYGHYYKSEDHFSDEVTDLKKELQALLK